MATIGDWLTGNFEFFGATVQNWMVTARSAIEKASLTLVAFASAQIPFEFE